MPAGQFTPGPILHFVQFNKPVLGYGIGSPVFLGTAVVAPDQEEEENKIPVLNDLGGRSVPFQLIQDGSLWIVLTTLNRFDLGVCRAIRSLQSGGPGEATNLNTLGSESGRARGTLVIGSQDFQLILVNSYGGTPSSGLPVAVQPDLNTARAFASCVPLKYKEDTKGTRVLEVAMALQCNNVFNPVTRGFRSYVESFGPFPIPSN